MAASFRVSATAVPSQHERLARLLIDSGQVVSPGQSSLARGIGCGALASNKRSRLLRYGIIEKVLPNLTAEHLKDPGYGDAVGLVRTHAKAKAALAIMAEFEKALGRRTDGPAHPDHLDEAACRIP